MVTLATVVTLVTAMTSENAADNLKDAETAVEEISVKSPGKTKGKGSHWRRIYQKLTCFRVRTNNSP